jgi:hypothetical protein
MIDPKYRPRTIVGPSWPASQTIHSGNVNLYKQKNWMKLSVIACNLKNTEKIPEKNHILDQSCQFWSIVYHVMTLNPIFPCCPIYICMLQCVKTSNVAYFYCKIWDFPKLTFFAWNFTCLLIIPHYYILETRFWAYFFDYVWQNTYIIRI